MSEIDDKISSLDDRIDKFLDRKLSKEELETTQLAAWQSAFGTTQLTHAVAKLESTEAENARLSAACAAMREEKCHRVIHNDRRWDGEPADHRRWQVERLEWRKYVGMYSTEEKAIQGMAEMNLAETDTAASAIVARLTAADAMAAAIEAACHAMEDEQMNGMVIWILPPHQLEGVHESIYERLSAARSDYKATREGAK